MLAFLCNSCVTKKPPLTEILHFLIVPLLPESLLVNVSVQEYTPEIELIAYLMDLQAEVNNTTPSIGGENQTQFYRWIGLATANIFLAFKACVLRHIMICVHIQMHGYVCLIKQKSFWLFGYLILYRKQR